MADIADDGAERADFFLKLAKEKQEAEARQNRMPPICRCYNCNAPLEGDLRWCDQDCLDDWQYREKLKA